MIKDIPHGWIESTLGDVVKVHNGYAFPSKDFQTAGVPLIRQSNLAVDRVSLEKCVYLDPKWLKMKPEFVLRKNDVLIGMSGSVGKLCVYDLDQPALQNQRTGRIVPLSTKFVEWRYIWQYLKGIERQLLEKGKGLGVLNVSAADVESLPFRLAPLAEQRRIVTKLEMLLGRVDSSQRRLAKIQVLLKRFRQSVLLAACSGRLTVDWRGNDASADDGFPEGWELKTLDSVFTVRTGGTPSRQVPAYFEKGTIPWVKTSEVQNCDIIHTEEFITERAARESNAKVFPTGTLLVAMYGEGKTRGQIGRLTFPAATNQACAALVNTALPQVTNQYVFFYLLSQYYELRAQSVGGNQPNLNLGIVKTWQVPLPPLPEQQEIIRRVEELFVLADRLEARFAEGRKGVESITQAILAKAFRGELVPTESELAKSEGRSFESAEELLKKIKPNSEGPLRGKTRHNSRSAHP